MNSSKMHAAIRTAIWVILTSLTSWWAYVHVPTAGQVVPWGLEFWQGIGVCVVFVFCVLHLAKGGVERDFESLLPRDPWRRAHAMSNRVKRLEGELATARGELAANVAAARGELDQLVAAGNLAGPAAPPPPA